MKRYIIITIRCILILIFMPITCVNTDNNLQGNMVEQDYNLSVELLLRAINTYKGKPEYQKIKGLFTPAKILHIAELLANDRYEPSEFFTKQDNNPPAPMINITVPEITDDEDYLVYCCDALTDFNSSLNVKEGGIIFEDPFYFLLASLNVSIKNELFILPINIPEEYENSWSVRSEIIEQLTKGKYPIEKYFQKAFPRNPQKMKLVAKILKLKGKELKGLRKNSMANLFLEKDFGLSVYSLYQFIPVNQ